MKPLVSSLVVLSSFWLGSGALNAQVNADATTVAAAGYQEFLRLPLQQKSFCAEHGITQKDCNGVITLGTPYQLQCMTPDHIRQYKAGMPVSHLAEKTHIFMFPVLFDGQAKLFLDVCPFEADRFEIACLGKSVLCKELNRVESAYPRTEGYSVQLIQNYQTGRYLVHVPQLNPENLTILSPTDRTDAPLSLSSVSMERMKQLLAEMKVSF